VAGNLVPWLERPKRWNLSITQAFLGDRASRVKGTATRRIEGARHVALQQQTPFSGCRVGLGSGAQQRFGIRMAGIVVDLIRARELHHPAEVHDRDSPTDMLDDV
jgi:hypothetical protein